MAVSSTQKIGLCMIVRDEADVIERCLASVKPLIGAWTICDTGSTDGTPERIAATLTGVPGELHRREWVDFGHNRTELMALARGSADYLLLLDADMTVERRGTLPELTADAYQLHHAGPIDYVIPRLVRGDLPWHYVGATHEYLASDDERTHVPLRELLVHHHGDGGSKADKFERDERLLRRDLERDPGDVRATFYLAQTMRDSSRSTEAIELYDRRVELGGWGEEVFFSAYQAGLLRAEEDPADAVRRLRAAHDLRPSRAEPLCEAATICRDLGRWEEAYELARRAVALPYPGDDLFMVRDVYEWRSLMELSAAAWQCGHYEESLAASERLLETPGLPIQAEHVAEGNRQWALGSLGRSAAPRRVGQRERLSALVDVELAEIRIDVEPAWPALNPSICADGEGYRMIVRTANYSVIDGVYRLLDGSDSVRTVNYVASLDEDLALRSLRPLVDRSEDDPASHPTNIRGFEDCRLIELDGRWFAIANVRDRNPDVRAEVALLELAGLGDDDREATVERVTVLPGPEAGRHEKNWMPFVRAGELCVVYTCAPTVVREIDREARTSTVLSDRVAPAAAAVLNGGSQGVRVDGGWLFVAHEAVQLGDRRRYSHRFVLIDDELTVAALSPLFSFTGSDVEYCSGLAVRGPELVMSFGIEDRVAALAVTDRDEVLESLELGED